MFYVYILQSKKDNNFYIGSTNNLKKRFWEHSNGKVFSTKARRPLVLIYYEAYLSEKDARKREQGLKLKANSFYHLKKRIKNSIQKI